MARKILLGFLVILVVIQFIRPEKNSGSADTPQDITHAVQVPPAVMTSLKTACYNCHSNHTEYPWYAHINPIGLWLANHVEEGKQELNFSEFSKYDKKRIDHKLEEIGEEVEEGHMPLPTYTWMHPESKLSPEQIGALVNWSRTERQRLASK